MASSTPVRITRVRDNVPLPTYATDGSVAFDIACIEDVLVPAHSAATIPTGLIIATPPGYMLLFAPRSSLFQKTGLRLGNTIGIVDQDFCGPQDELSLSLWNPSEKDVQLRAGDRLVQGVFVAITRATWQEAPPSAESSRGGWGHTGGYTTS